MIFEHQHWTLLGQMYFAKDYSHKYERVFSKLPGKASSTELQNYYPWVERSCDETECIENLFIRNREKDIKIHQIHLERYRIEPIFDSKFQNRSCPL